MNKKTVPKIVTKYLKRAINGPLSSNTPLPKRRSKEEMSELREKWLPRSKELYSKQFPTEWLEDNDFQLALMNYLEQRMKTRTSPPNSFSVDRECKNWVRKSNNDIIVLTTALNKSVQKEWKGVYPESYYDPK